MPVVYENVNDLSVCGWVAVGNDLRKKISNWKYAVS